MNEYTWQETLHAVVSELEKLGAAYCVTGESALFLQGVILQPPDVIEISFQWDFLDLVYTGTERHGATPPLHRTREQAQFAVERDRTTVQYACQFNSVVEADPYRILHPVVEEQGLARARDPVWVKSVYAFLQNRDSSEWTTRIRKFLQNVQDDNTKLNRTSWEKNVYDAWVRRFGTPEQAADTISRYPAGKVQSLWPHLGDIRGKRIVNLMGSSGVKGVALSLLGANVTVVDFSEDNRRFAMDLADKAKVSMEYIVADVLHLPEMMFQNPFDIVVMELGILHYFVDLQPLFEVIERLVGNEGRFVLHDFHPISTKLITSTGKKHKVTGNYFDVEFRETRVAHAKHQDAEGVGKAGDVRSEPSVRIHEWTLGEIVTAVAQSGLRITALVEEPNHKLSDFGLPKTYTLVASKDVVHASL